MNIKATIDPDICSVMSYYSYLGRVNANVHVSTVCFLALNSLNIYYEFFPVYLDDFSYLLTLVVATYYL